MKQILLMKKEIYKKLSGHELAIYCVLLSFLNPDDYILYVHTEIIASKIKNTLVEEKYFLESTKKSLESLIKKTFTYNY